MSIIRRIKVNDLRSPTHHGIHRLHAQSAFLESFFRGYKETHTGAMGDEEISLKYDNVLVTAPLFIFAHRRPDTLTDLLLPFSKM